MATVEAVPHRRGLQEVAMCIYVGSLESQRFRYLVDVLILISHVGLA